MRHIILFLCLLSLSCQIPSASANAPGPWANAKAKKRYGSIWRIITKDCAGIGTAVAIGPNRLVTAKHVVFCPQRNFKGEVVDLLESTDIEAYHVISEKSFKVTIERASDSTDVAYLTINERVPHYMEVVRRNPRVGEQLCYMGGNAVVNRTLTKCGEFYLHDNNIPGMGWVYIRVVPGNSGGPVFDAQWRVIGVMSTQDYGSGGKDAYDPGLIEHAGGFVKSMNFPMLEEFSPE